MPVVPRPARTRRSQMLELPLLLAPAERTASRCRHISLPHGPEPRGWCCCNGGFLLVIPRGESYPCARRGWRCTQRGRCVAEAQNPRKMQSREGCDRHPCPARRRQSTGLPGCTIVGLPDAAIREWRHKGPRPRSVQRVAAGVTEGRRRTHACEGRVGQSRIDYQGQRTTEERRLTPGSELPWSRHLAVRPSRRRCANRRYRSCRVSGAPFCERNYQSTCPGAPRNLGSCNPHRCGQLGFWRRRRWSC